MKMLLFSDLHSDFQAASRLIQRSHEADIVIGAGDLCIARRGLNEIIQALSRIDKPTILVPGNAESDEELQAACRSWPAAHVLHGRQLELAGMSFFGIGGGIPVTPFGSWSYDFTEKEALQLLKECPEGGVLVSHSPPKGVVDYSSDGRHLGSEAIQSTIVAKQPKLVVCGHIHGSDGKVDQLGKTTVINAGPRGMVWDLE